MFETRITVRGYEIDSYNHVNNAVYLSYMEHARWEILNKTGIIDYVKRKNLLIVVTGTNIRYKGMAKLFDELVITTKIEREDPYIIFRHGIFNVSTDRKITTASVKTILIDENHIPVDIPDELADIYFRSTDDNKQ